MIVQVSSLEGGAHFEGTAQPRARHCLLALSRFRKTISSMV